MEAEQSASAWSTVAPRLPQWTFSGVGPNSSTYGLLYRGTLLVFQAFPLKAQRITSEFPRAGVSCDCCC